MNFRWNRFLPDPSTGTCRTTLTKNGKTIDTWKVFVGGSHLCPGRNFIRYEARACIDMMLRRFELRLKNGLSIPAVDPRSIGVSRPRHDVMVEIESGDAVKNYGHGDDGSDGTAHNESFTQGSYSREPKAHRQPFS